MPEPALFELSDLYEVQSPYVLLMHGMKLQELDDQNSAELTLYELEQVNRSPKVVELPDGFEDFEESVEHLTNEELSERVNALRERRAALLSHQVMITVANQNKRYR